MSRATPQVTLWATGDARHQPYLLAGLMALQKADELELRVVPRVPRIHDRLVVTGGQMERIDRAYPWSYLLDIKDPVTGRTVRAAVDLQDWKNFFSNGDLRSCDILFKRSFDPHVAGLISSKFGIPVIPAGMTHSAKLDGAYSRTLAIAGLVSKFESFLTGPRRAVKSLWKSFGNSKTPATKKSPAKSATPVEANLEGSAFFQILCHGDGTWREAEELNRSRAELIRAMRSSLGTRFQGGMYFEGEPRPEFADCLSNLPNSPKEYLTLVKSASVVISTNGFGGSVPWKLCEYLSLGKCIVAQGLQHSLPNSIGHGNEVAFFENYSECASLCLKLLAAPDERKRMEQKASQYYLDHVAPAAATLRIIKTAVESITGPSRSGDDGRPDNSSF